MFGSLTKGHNILISTFYPELYTITSKHYVNVKSPQPNLVNLTNLHYVNFKQDLMEYYKQIVEKRDKNEA